MRQTIPPAVARYGYLLRTGPSGGEVLVVIDHDKDRSVTNDAAAVIAEISQALGGLYDRPVVYRDTQGRYDGIEHDGHRFLGFYPVGTYDQDEAVAFVDVSRSA